MRQRTPQIVEKSRVRRCLLWVLIAATVTGLGAVSELGRRERTDDLAEAVGTKLSEQSVLAPCDIMVVSQAGKVTLMGTVDSDEERREAETLARRTKGVQKVVDHLRVTHERNQRSEDVPLIEWLMGDVALAGSAVALVFCTICWLHGRPFGRWLWVTEALLIAHLLLPPSNLRLVFNPIITAQPRGSGRK
jgi:hypothetical protein